MTSEVPQQDSFDVGQLWYSFDDDHWEWSDEVARMRRYTSADAGEPIGTTGYYIVLSDHKVLAEAADVVHDELRRTVHEQVEEALAHR
ncbi:hypothetical protein HH308_11490 [Gordonia sp. TBRC 11910]|uniref:Uncharacterized protein n=1 Tax=Gordonia asplenii TaxID=2725283 RepID=A0A848KS98_9ACTN|nr:hypothetical protein [Gordonia asplenii]NMO01834.1 hypothetical protein [Gordonia asplenii]